MKLVLQRAEINQREIALEVYALTKASLPEKVGDKGEVVWIRPVPGGEPTGATLVLYHSAIGVRTDQSITWAAKEAQRRAVLKNAKRLI